MGKARKRSRVLIIVDKRGWSYETIAKGLQKYNSNDSLVLDIASAVDDEAQIAREHRSYDLVFPLGWTDALSKDEKSQFADRLAFVDRHRIITGIHSHRSWDGYQSMPEQSPMPPARMIQKLSECRGVNAISRRLYDIFRRAGLRNITLTENGVDTDLFSVERPVQNDRSRPLVLGFSGSTRSAKHDRLKGFSEFIAPLGGLPNVQVEVLGGRGLGQVAREDMPALYNRIDLYICASTSEGFSQSVLEASACGRGVLSTSVGGSEDLILPGLNGFLVDRDLEAFKTIVTALERDRRAVAQLGENNRRRVESQYAWRVRVGDWLRFIESNLGASVEAKV